MLRRARVVCLLVIVLAAAGLRAAEKISIMPLARDGAVLVTFELTDALSDQLQEAIHSGLAVTFLYEVDLRRGVPFWVDRTIASATVGASVQYDNLTRRHQLSRTIDGRTEPHAVVTESEDVVRRWLSTFERLPLFSTASLEANAEYYVRVRVRTRPQLLGFLRPWTGGTSGAAKFTFIP